MKTGCDGAGHSTGKFLSHRRFVTLQFIFHIYSRISTIFHLEEILIKNSECMSDHFNLTTNE